MQRHAMEITSRKAKNLDDSRLDIGEGKGLVEIVRERKIYFKKFGIECIEVTPINRLWE
jgi:hypothetical protein